MSVTFSTEKTRFSTSVPIIEVLLLTGSFLREFASILIR